MISPEMLRRYPFFAGLDHEQLADVGHDGRRAACGARALSSFTKEMRWHRSIWCLEGSVAIILDVPTANVEQTVAQQLTGQLQTTAVTISIVGPGDPFGWTAVTLTHVATAGAMAISACQVVAFDRQQLLEAFEADCAFGYLMLQQIVQVAKQRLHDLRVESLSQTAHLDTLPSVFAVAHFDRPGRATANTTGMPGLHAPSSEMHARPAGNWPGAESTTTIPSQVTSPPPREDVRQRRLKEHQPHGI